MSQTLNMTVDLLACVVTALSAQRSKLEYGIKYHTERDTLDKITKAYRAKLATTEDAFNTFESMLKEELNEIELAKPDKPKAKAKTAKAAKAKATKAKPKRKAKVSKITPKAKAKTPVDPAKVKAGDTVFVENKGGTPGTARKGLTKSFSKDGKTAYVTFPDVKSPLRVTVDRLYQTADGFIS
jgi:hypothetical protein